VSNTRIASALRELIESRPDPVPLPPPAERRALRVLGNTTQRELGQIIGTSRAAVTRYEGGTREPRGDTRRRYAEVLEVLRRGL